MTWRPISDENLMFGESPDQFRTIVGGTRQIDKVHEKNEAKNWRKVQQKISAVSLL